MSSEYQDTVHQHTDGYTNWWTSKHESTPNPHGEYREDLHDDVAAAVSEAKGRSETDDELEQSKTDIETLRKGFGSLTAAAEFYDNIDRLYWQDPAAGREAHQRWYSQRLPANAELKAKPARETPPADLTPAGRDEWELQQAAKTAYRDVGDEVAYRADVEAAKPYLAALKARYGGSLAVPLMKAAALHLAMQTNPSAASEKMSMLYGSPTSTAHQNEVIAQVQHQQYAGELQQGLEQMVAAGQLPHMNNPNVEAAVVNTLRLMTANGWRSANPYDDLLQAHAFVLDGRYQQLVEGANQQQYQQQQQAAAQRARRASRSLSGGGTSGDIAYAEKRAANHEDDIYSDVRKAMYAGRV